MPDFIKGLEYRILFYRWIIVKKGDHFFHDAASLWFLPYKQFFDCALGVSKNSIFYPMFFNEVIPNFFIGKGNSFPVLKTTLGCVGQIF
jgi:hypothetical protein